MNVAALTMNDPERTLNVGISQHSHSAPAPNAGTLTESAAHHHHQHHGHHQILENVNEVSIQPSVSTQSTSNDNENHASLNSDEQDRKYRKPPYTYTELITQALKDQKALTVSGIYNWIT